MSATRRLRRKKYFTPAEANATLPLVRSILRDVMALAGALRERHDRLVHLHDEAPERLGRITAGELEEMEADLDRDRKQMQEYEGELRQLGVELKDYYTGLIDFPCILEGREVYLCWKMGEPEVAHWHEVDAGFSGRQSLHAGVDQR